MYGGNVYLNNYNFFFQSFDENNFTSETGNGLKLVIK